MSSKRRPISASFKEDAKKASSQRARPSTARSTASRQSFNASFRSDVSGLSITGTKTAQSKPTSQPRRSMNLSFDKNEYTSSTNSAKNNIISEKGGSKFDLKRDVVNHHVIGKDEKPKMNKDSSGSSDPVERFEAEKDDPWWENIPDEITFSPASSISYGSSRSGLTKTLTNTKNDSLRPSMNDFLDLSDESKANLAEDATQRCKENSYETISNPCGDSSQNSFSSSKKIGNNLQNKGNFSKPTEKNFKTVNSGLDEAMPRNSNTIPRLALDENYKDYSGNSYSYNQKASVCDEQEREMAALTIQRCYRGYKTRTDAGYSAVQKALEERRTVIELQKKEKEDSNSSSDRQRRRDEKARQARQAAIQELNQKRERKKELSKRMAEEELKFLEENGKVTKAKNYQIKQRYSKKKSSEKTYKKMSKDDALANPSTASTSTSTLDSKVEEIFQESRTTNIQTGSKQNLNENLSEASTSRSEKTAKNSFVSGTKSTLDDLFESLRQLEEEPADLKKEEKSSVSGWLDALGSQQKASQNGSRDSKLTQDALRQSTNGSTLSQEKLRTIMSFLDEVEKTDQDTVVSRLRDAKTLGEASSLGASLISPRADAEKEIALLESASAAASDVTNAMMSVKVELEEKRKTNELLQRALNQQREFTLRQARDIEKDAKQRLDLQRQEYESTIQRHLSFIDQLIDDKKILGDRCEELVKKLKETDKKYVDKISSLEQNHSAEMKKQKDIMQTAEKLRREKWIKDKSQQIKELTVKGLEPDIQKLIAKHKAELKRLKSSHQADLLETDERVGRRYLSQIEELREQLEREKEAACNRERDLAQTKFQKQMEEEEQAFQQQRRRLYAEIQEEKERLAVLAQKQRKELDDLKEKLEGSHKAAMNTIEISSKQSLDDLEHRHQSEMKELKERLEIEKQQWIENYMKKQDAMLLQKERELKESVHESRDKEIELVIRRLEEETSRARDECERAAENRIKRVRDKYEAEMKELERSEKAMHEKYTTVKEHSNELEEEVSRLKTSLKNEERKMEDLNTLTKRLQEERGQVVDIIRQEFADRLVTTDEDNKRLKIEMSELRAKHRLEIERINNSKEEEMEEVHKRVKQAISKKEETLNSLRQQKESAEKRADHLEFLLHEQRKKLLT